MKPLTQTANKLNENYLYMYVSDICEKVGVYKKEL